MNEIRFKHGDKVCLVTRGNVFAKILRIFYAKGDGMPETEIYVVERETPDPLTGSFLDTAFRNEIGPVDPMDAERLRRRMEFEVASGRGKG